MRSRFQFSPWPTRAAVCAVSLAVMLLAIAEEESDQQDQSEDEAVQVFEDPEWDAEIAKTIRAIFAYAGGDVSLHAD